MMIHKIFNLEFCHTQSQSKTVASCPVFPSPNTNLRKRDKRSETANTHNFFVVVKKAVKQGDWSRGY